jgi:Spy/CpxP family protein refolding chaperone
MKRTMKLAIGLGAAASLGLAAAAFAHPGYGPGAGFGGGPGYGMGGGMGMGYGMGPGMRGGGSGMGGYGMGFQGSEDRLAAQKSALKITAAQEKAWDEYASVAKKQSDAMLAQRDAMHGTAPASAAERQELHAAFMKQRVEQMEAMNGAFKKLYEVLTPEQRTVLDQRSGFGPRAGRGWR